LFIGNQTVNGSAKNIFPTSFNCTGPCFAYGNDLGFNAPQNASGVNVGTSSIPVYPVGIDGNTGIYSTGSAAIDFTSLGVNSAEVGSSFIWVKNANGLAIGTSSNSWVSAPSSGNFTFGVAAQGSTGKLKASGLISAGTRFTTNNGCTDGANAGGATAGYFIVGSTSCTEVITMGDSATSANGWSCTVVDITTLADVTNPHQTTSTTTTATIVTGTVVSGDKIQFSCIGY
jgi:hypothetical protein